MRWQSSEKKILTIITIVGVTFYALYKGLQLIVGALGGDIDVAIGKMLGGMFDQNRIVESRRVETDAPVQIIYRIDKNRYLTLENYISCNRGGQVYYNDIHRGLKTILGWDNDFYDFSYRLGNHLAAYQGTIINGANNGYLAFPGASNEQFCGSGRISMGCPVFLFFSADYGKSFIYKIIAQEYRAPEYFSQLKVIVANDGVYFRDESQKENAPTHLKNLYSVNKLRFSDGKLVNVYSDWHEKFHALVKKELIKKKITYANEYGPEFNIFSYMGTLTPLKTHDEINVMADELSDIKLRVRGEVYRNKIEFPVLVTESADVKYTCNKNIEAENITYKYK